MAWSVPEPPEGPAGPATLTVVPGARLTRWSATPTGVGHHHRSTGAVYTRDGGLVPQSLRAGGFDGDHVTPRDPPVLEGVRGDVHLGGRWLYGGHWMGAFGHFLTETLTSLWPEPPAVRGLIFHRFLQHPVVWPWQLVLLERSGWRLPFYVAERVVDVDELLVPSRPFRPGRCTGPESARAWRRGVRPAAPGPPVFLSRSRLGAHRQRSRGDERLDAGFAALGFRVLHPQTLTLAEQLDATGGAPVIAGVSGSALHLSALVPDGPRLLELGDSRTPDHPIRTQVVIDAARRRETAFVPFLVADDAGSRDVAATLDRVRALV